MVGVGGSSLQADRRVKDRAPVTRFRGAKILLADDSAQARRVGSEILSAEGHEVSAVSNGQAAIKMLKEHVPDLIVADVFMPGRTGYELCRFVKSYPEMNHIPVLLIVGKMEPYDPNEGRRLKADGVVTKPLESSDLVARVRELLASHIKPAVPAVPVEETATWEVPEVEPEEEISPAVPQRLEIPEEIAQQPLSIYADLFGDTTETAALTAAPTCRWKSASGGDSLTRP